MQSGAAVEAGPRLWRARVDQRGEAAEEAAPAVEAGLVQAFGQRDAVVGMGVLRPAVRVVGGAEQKVEVDAVHGFRSGLDQALDMPWNLR